MSISSLLFNRPSHSHRLPSTYTILLDPTLRSAVISSVLSDPPRGSILSGATLPRATFTLLSPSTATQKQERNDPGGGVPPRAETPPPASPSLTARHLPVCPGETFLKDPLQGFFPLFPKVSVLFDFYL